MLQQDLICILIPKYHEFVKRKILNEDDGDNVVIEKTNVSPKDLNRKKFDS